MALVLGIDAAWTERGSSGVALLECTKSECRIILSAPSYSSFIAYSTGKPIEWRNPAHGPLDVSALLAAAEKIGKASIDVVAIDMPVARQLILRRRNADSLISKKFGGAWASTHSPTPERPGRYGHQLAQKLIGSGFPLITGARRSTPALIEVYPLAALVRLLNANKRPTYKASKSRKYWPGTNVAARIDNLIEVWSDILACLRQGISELNFKLPARDDLVHLSQMKPYEDALDAVISAYVGALYLRGDAEQFGDHDAAIWVPNPGTVHQGTTRYLKATHDLLSEWNTASDAQAFEKL